MKWLYSLFLLVSLSVFATVFILPTSANASSSYDNIIKPATSPYNVSYGGSTSNSFTSGYDIGTYLSSYTDATDVLNKNYGFCSTNTIEQAQAVYDAIQHIKGGGQYLISAVQGSGENYVVVSVNMDNNTTWDWYSSGYLFFSSPTQKIVEFTIQFRNASSSGLCIASSTYQYSVYAGQPNTDYKFVETNVPITNYPPDYAGHQPVIVQPSIPDTSKLRPNITIDVMDKQVTLNSKINETVKAQYPNYKVYWFITNATFDGTGVPEGCGDTAFTTSGYSIPSEPLHFQVPCYTTYSVNAYFAYDNGSYPLDDFADWHIVETTINVDINGGFFSIDTDNSFVCDNSNYCQHESALWVDQQCDLLHMGGCVNNILHYLSVALGIDKTATNPTGSPFVSFRTESYGLLTIITAPLVAINALTTTSCSAITFTIPYVNTNVTLPCYYSIYQSYLGSVFTIYQTIATGVVAYYVIVGILRHVKELKDPKKDQIEVVQL